MFENPRRSRQARNFTTNVPKILDLKSSSEQTFFRKLSLGALTYCFQSNTDKTERWLLLFPPYSIAERFELTSVLWNMDVTKTENGERENKP